MVINLKNIFSICKDKSLITLISIFSFALNFFNISNNGYSNTYYAAAIKSMSISFKNFFFVSFDPAGIVTVDKPPFGFWVQFLFTKIFGYSGAAIILPQALAGAISTVLIYILVIRHFDKNIALLSAFLFSLTPIVVAVSRNNTIDMQLVFVLLIATFFLFKAIDTHKLKYLIISSILIGIGFNIKMLQAYMVLPAFAVTYFIFCKENFKTKCCRLTICLITLLIISFSWVTIVDLYPKDYRPYVGSSTNNTEMELIFDHNGLERLTRSKGPNVMFQNAINNKNSNNILNNKISDQQSVKMSDFSQNQNNNMRGETGSASLTRFFNNNIYGQISWFLPIVIIYIIFKIKNLINLKSYQYFFWVLWFLTMFIFFSFAGFYHRYYLCMVAPAIAVISSIAVFDMIHLFAQKDKYIRYIFSATYIITIVFQIIHIINYSTQLPFLIPIMVIFIALTLILIIRFNKTKLKHLYIKLIALFSIISLTIAPLTWCITTISNSSNSVMPYAGPEISNKNDTKNFVSDRNNLSNNLIDYLVKNYTEGSYLVVTRRASDVSDIIIKTGLPAVAYGGFLGSDNALTLDKFKELVYEKKIKYFLITNENMPNNQNNNYNNYNNVDSKTNSNDIIEYVKQNAKLVDSSEYNKISNNVKIEDKRQSLYIFN